MFQFFTEDLAGIPAQTLNWIAFGICIIIVLLVLLVMFRIFRGSGLGNGRRGRHARLAVTDAASIGDDRRKLVLIRRDNVEHLLLIGGANDLVIESDIIRTAPQQAGARPPAQKAAPVATETAPPQAAAPVATAKTPAQPAAPVATAKTPDQAAAAPVQLTVTPHATPMAKPAKAAPSAVVDAPAPVATPTPVSPPNPVPVVDIATKAVAAAAATGATITSAAAAETSAETHSAIPEVAKERVEDSAPEVKIDGPTAAPAVKPPAEAVSSQPLNSVEEMDALLNEITTEK